MPHRENLTELERTREQYWARYPGTSPLKLRWRAATLRHFLHVLPGESILEIGAGSGLWTEHLASVLRGENPITAAIFNPAFSRHPRWNSLANVRPLLVDSLDELPAASFDHIAGTSILCHNRYPETLRSLHRLLKPGGSLLFFENNFWNPQVLLKSVVPGMGRWAGNAGCQVGLRRNHLAVAATRAGFANLDVVPYDIVHPLFPRRWLPAVQSFAFLVEHMPLMKEFSGTLSIRARRPGAPAAPRFRNLATIPQFRHAVSFVVPCRNEEANVRKLVESLVRFYDPYIREILIVDDNSTDRTADAARALASADSRVKMLRRTPPNGVGLALREGIAAASGEFIFTLDADFVQLVPEFRDLFDAVADGCDGAVGSRFTQESIMINYPFLKILSNRAFHLAARLLLPFPVHDISNNLKLFRAGILKEMTIAQPDFAANAEIGLKALAAGYRVREVPVSWIHRTEEMGRSSFHIAQVAPNYFRALVEVVRLSRRPAREPAGDLAMAASAGKTADGPGR